MMKKLLAFMLLLLGAMQGIHAQEPYTVLSDGDIFTANTVEGVEMTFKVISTFDKTCQVGDGSYDKCAINKNTQGSLTIPAEVNGYQVVAIGESALSGCKELTSLTIPNKVKTIGEAAFYGCSGLISVIIPDNVTSIERCAFQHCSGLTSITIPNSVASIADYAFLSCTGLSSVTIPRNTTYIGRNIFERCSGLNSIVVETDNTVYDSRDNCNAIINSSTNELIAGCKNTIIPDNVKTIGYQAFMGCSGLTSVTIPNSVTSIDWYAFDECSGLTSILIPKSVTSIGWSAFHGCSSLTSIVVEDGNLYYDSRGNCNAIIEKSTNKLVTGCMNTIIPDGVTIIGYGAFSECSGLTSITIPDGVNTIDGDAFAACRNLTTVTIPNSVTSIGPQAFCYCPSLTNFYCMAEEVPTTESDDLESPFYDWNSPFYYTNLKNVTLHVPVGCVNAYKAVKPWSDFGTITDDTGSEEPDLNDGDIFTANTVEGVEMTFKVISANDKTCQVGEGLYDNCAIDEYTQGSLTIPAEVNGYQVVAIGDYALSWCWGLTSLTIPYSVTNIGDEALTSCSSLTSIVVEDGNTMYDSRENCNAIINSTTNELIVGCKNSFIPNSVTSIGYSAFESCDFESINIPSSVTSIESFAFWGCSSLTSITIPSSVTAIGVYAFSYCSALNEVISYISEPFTIGTSVWNNLSTNDITLYVPMGTKALYEATEGWNVFTNIVEMKPTILGDVNHDGSVTMTDVLMILSYILGDNPKDFDKTVADLNGDNSVTIADATMLIITYSLMP